MQRALAPLLTLLVVTVAAAGAAAAPCDLEVTGARTPDWDEAVGDLALDRTGSGDCAVLRLHVGEEMARLTFVTKDGRSAERELHSPSELAPTVDALLVTGAPSGERAEAAPIATEAPAATFELATGRPPPTLDRVEPSRATNDAGSDVFVTFGVELGVRGGSGLVGPMLGPTASVTLRPWELGVWGSYEPSYTRFATKDSAPADAPASDAPSESPPPMPPPPPPKGSALGAGIFVGRRLPFSHLDMVAFGRLGVAALRAEDTTRQSAEARIGAGLRLVFPRTAALRFRVTLGGDLMPTDLRRPSSVAVPWWAFSGTLGVEAGGT